jgi:hypothetical protein
MSYKTHSDIFVYHDETGKIQGHNIKGAHVFLFVPHLLRIDRDAAQTTLVPSITHLESYSPLKILFQEITDLRSVHQAHHKFHFTDITGKTWTAKNNAEREALEVGIDSFKKSPQTRFVAPMWCKLAAIFYPSAMLSSYGGHRAEREYRYYETVFRILLKSSLHFFYSPEDTVEVRKIISGGTPYHRQLDSYRIIEALRADDSLRTYVTLAPDLEIVQQTCDHNRCKEGTDEFMHSMMLQLADLFLGAIRHVITTKRTSQTPTLHVGSKVVNKRGLVSYPVASMIEEWRRNPFSSRCDFHKSISVTQASFKDGNWKFETIRRLIGDSSLLDFRNSFI